ncbi:MAG: 30S ribosomal protein S3 [Chloroflexi bacterium]|jgi:small subunit ribosomal protein S3|nr:30S ribosomal protein S3 [Chloroflexota bacterium]MDA1281374.1 30S ribosomal protein S3 [Chloroflexota bacterium]
MGQKTHPIGFRLGGVQDWRAHWFASKSSDYRRLTEEDQKIRGLINDQYAESGAISRVEIERGAQDLVVTINTARPGIIIGRGGTRVDELRGDLEKLTEKRSRLNIQEIRQPELDATLVGQSIAEQLERRVAYRRAVRMSIQRTMQSGALGIKVVVSGRIGGAEIARTDKQKEGRTPLHTLRAQIDFAVSEAKTTFGVIGVKVWIYTGDMIPSAENLRARSMARLSMGAAQEGQGQGEQDGKNSSGGGRGSSPKKPEQAGGGKK